MLGQTIEVLVMVLYWLGHEDSQMDRKVEVELLSIKDRYRLGYVMGV